MHPDINPHVLNLKESATLRINEQIRKLRDTGKEIFHFGFGQSPFPVPHVIQSALKEHADKKSYLPTQGLPELLDMIGHFYREQCGYAADPDQICIGPGSKELIFQTIYLLEGPLLIPAPSWVSYGPQAAIRGKQIVTIKTRRDLGYRLQAEELDRACQQTPATQKILIFNNPSNPTGSRHSEQEIKDLALVCRAHKVIAISDEIYGLITFDKTRHTSLVHHYPEGTIVTGGLSKAFSAGGYRLGLMIVPRHMRTLMQSLLTMISETFSAVSSPVQYAALAAYEYHDEIRKEVERCVEIHKFATLYLHQRFIKMKLNCPQPQGAFYLFPDFENFRPQLAAKSIVSSRQLVATVLSEARVAMLPGSDFYLEPTDLAVRVASVDYDGALALKQFPGSHAMDDEQLVKLFPNLVYGCDKLEKFLTDLPALPPT